MNIEDMADQAAELFLKASLSNKMKELPITGFCWWCNEESKGVFCDVHCAKDYEKHKQFNHGS